MTDSANWTPAGVPGSSDVADFGQAGSNADITVTGTDTVGELAIHGDAVTFASGTVTTDGLPDTTYNGTVGTAIDDGGSLTLGTATTTATLDTGTLFVGALSQGSLTVDGGSAVHADRIEVGGSFNLAASSTVTGTIDLDGGTINVVGSGTESLSNAFNLETGGTSAPGMVNAGNSQLTLTGALSDDDEVGGSGDDNGPGTLAVEGFVRLSHAGNTYSGGTILDSGANLRVAADGAAGTGAITMNASGVTLAVAPGVTLANTVKGFQQGDQIVLAGLAATSASWANGVLTVDDGTTKVDTLNLAGDYSRATFSVTGNGKGDSVITVGGPLYTNTFTLTTGTDTVTGTAGNDLIIAAGGTLNAGDTIDGGGGANALELQGGGVFHLDAPTTLQNVQTLYASEGGTSSDQQNVFLRDGTNLTVDVSGSSDNPKAPWLNSITIHGANNSDTINLGPGYDTVVLGSAKETVVGGSGTVGIIAGSNMLGATLSGGSGGGTLMVTGGGPGVMGDTITRMQKVILSDTMDFTANAESGLTIIGASAGDTIRAGGADQTIVGYNGSGNSSGGPHAIGGFATLVGSTAGHDTFSDNLVDFGYDTIQSFSAPGDVIDVTDVAPGSLSLNYGDGTLQLGNGSSTVSINLPGTFDPSGFQMASDNHGGTDITYTAPTATATTASKLTSAMASFSATSGGLDTASPSATDQHAPLLAASTGHA